MIRILTDSASDILPAEAAQLGVDVIPLNVTLEDGTVIRDGVDLTPSEYYEHMAGCKKLPTTSQPSPELFEKFYAEAAAAGDEVVGIFLSHELSGTYQCAKLAADLANVDNVLFVDSTNVCLGEGLLVRMAAHLRDEGKRAADKSLNTWWLQACQQADRAGLKPALIYRLDRQEWRVVVAMQNLFPPFEYHPIGLTWTVEMSLPAWCAVVREGMTAT